MKKEKEKRKMKTLKKQQKGNKQNVVINLDYISFPEKDYEEIVEDNKDNVNNEEKRKRKIK
jgi:hypothetical protein